jgi:hypothetical protein
MLPKAMTPGVCEHGWQTQQRNPLTCESTSCVLPGFVNTHNRWFHSTLNRSQMPMHVCSSTPARPFALLTCKQLQWCSKACMPGHGIDLKQEQAASRSHRSYLPNPLETAVWHWHWPIKNMPGVHCSPMIGLSQRRHMHQATQEQLLGRCTLAHKSGWPCTGRMVVLAVCCCPGDSSSLLHGMVRTCQAPADTTCQGHLCELPSKDCCTACCTFGNS